MKSKVLITTIVFLCGGTFCLLRYNKNHRRIDINRCLKNIENILPGEWQSLDSDYPAVLYLKLNENGTFIYDTRHKTEDQQYELEGDWELIDTNNAIKLKFKELNEPWEKILSDDSLVQNYPGVIASNLEKKEIIFVVEYFDEGDEESCQAERYGIDILNVYLYKK